jgi:hypothetical protein
MAKSGYIIDDEPAQGGPYQRYIVDPMWPLLAVMMAGVWLGWPWLLFNGKALGSPNWRRQAEILAVGFAGTVALALAIVALWDADIIRTTTHVRLALLTVTVWKLAISYKVHALQSGTFELFVHYGGEPFPGMRVLMLGIYVGRALMLGVIDSVLWLIIISGGVFGGDMVAEGLS